MPPLPPAWAAVAHKEAFHPGLPEMAAIISSVCKDADAGDRRPPVGSCFYADQVSSASVGAYLRRIVKYGECSNKVFINMFILIDRFAIVHPLTSQGVHRVIAAAFVVSVMGLQDKFQTYSDYAWICGLKDSSEMHNLVCEFFRAVDFDVAVSSGFHDHVETKLGGSAN
eukprot:TRINITY_DN1456_c0_g1_i2.p1 TRINITY_DN1456_c0_g1~~TRINITY_DN1456_c0_g1_i2.p1  ORF type:complete len:169 (+),score=44.60 TRINITY_DN1456_c0_g1_i2:102-608(+)